jgi:Lipocalin-like domain
VKRSILLMVLPLFALLCRASAQTDRTASAQPGLVGTWRLVSFVGEEVPSGVRSDVMGAHPGGYINYGRDGRMIVIIVGSERRKPAGPVVTPEEAAALMRSMLAYAGRTPWTPRRGPSPTTWRFHGTRPARVNPCCGPTASRAIV